MIQLASRSMKKFEMDIKWEVPLKFTADFIRKNKLGNFKIDQQDDLSKTCSQLSLNSTFKEFSSARMQLA